MSTPKRRKILFLSHLYPSSRGTGSQIRAAATVRMLATRHDVYLIIANYNSRVPGPHDPHTERCCRVIRCLSLESMGKVLPDPQQQPLQTPEIDFVPIDLLDVEEGDSRNPVLGFFLEHQLDELFLFTLTPWVCIDTCLHSFPQRSLDLDEMASVRESRIADVKRELRGLPTDALDQTRLKTRRVLERAVIPTFHRVFVSSEIEAECVRKLIGVAAVHVLPNIRPVPSIPSGQSARNPREILFIGSLSYYPNQDAVHFFAGEIFPLLRHSLGDSALFRVIGFDCPPTIRALHGNGVEITGHVEDLGPWYERASIVVVPLRAAGGTRLKILEAFAYGRPVVSTTIGAEGLSVTPGKNILLADSVADFAAACRELLEQPSLAAQLASSGRELARDHYSEQDLLRRYEEAIGNSALS